MLTLILGTCLFFLSQRNSGVYRPRECDWQLTFVDFGMIGRVPEHMQAGIREAAIGVGTRDSERLTRAYQMLGLLLPNADLSLLKQAEEKIFDRFWGKDMSELRQIGYDELGELAYEFRELLYSMPFQIPEDFILIRKGDRDSVRDLYWP
jgi:predicted unusual protein kinase regulating ubiquinone biosynthesis (AarF/ABC1/UbiB family)